MSNPNPPIPKEINVDEYDIDVFSMAYEKFQNAKHAAEVHGAAFQKAAIIVNRMLADLKAKHNITTDDYELNLQEKKFIRNEDNPPTP